MEGAEARQLRTRRPCRHIHLAKVVKNVALREGLFGEGNVIVIVEIAPEGLDPGKFPPHALLIR
jgi:hypothetical protein